MPVCRPSLIDIKMQKWAEDKDRRCAAIRRDLDSKLRHRDEVIRDRLIQIKAKKLREQQEAARKFAELNASILILDAELAEQRRRINARRSISRNLMGRPSNRDLMARPSNRDLMVRPSRRDLMGRPSLRSLGRASQTSIISVTETRQLYHANNMEKRRQILEVIAEMRREPSPSRREALRNRLPRRRPPPVGRHRDRMRRLCENFDRNKMMCNGIPLLDKRLGRNLERKIEIERLNRRPWR